MNDKAAGNLIAVNALEGSILVDGGYRLSDPRFIGPPPVPNGHPLKKRHSGARVIVERFFGKLKTVWKMVGLVYTKDKKYHGLVIRCAVILTNMLIVHEGGLHDH